MLWAKESQKRIGTLPQEFTAFDRLNVGENISFLHLFNDENLDVGEVISLTGLEACRKNFRSCWGIETACWDHM